jgi:hypothetical protein
MKRFATIISALMVSGCAGLQFDNDSNAPGALFFDPMPVVQVACDKDGVSVASVLVLPDPSKPHHVKAVSGWGSAKTNVAFSNGMLTSFGQETDTKIPETLNAITNLAGLFGGGKSLLLCKPGSAPKLYPLTVVNGKPALGDPL